MSERIQVAAAAGQAAGVRGGGRAVPGREDGAIETIRMNPAIHHPMPAVSRGRPNHAAPDHGRIREADRQGASMRCYFEDLSRVCRQGGFDKCNHTRQHGDGYFPSVQWALAQEHEAQARQDFTTRLNRPGE
jgi:hypothetical protein